MHWRAASSASRTSRTWRTSWRLLKQVSSTSFLAIWDRNSRVVSRLWRLFPLKVNAKLTGNLSGSLHISTFSWHIKKTSLCRMVTEANFNIRTSVKRPTHFKKLSHRVSHVIIIQQIVCLLLWKEGPLFGIAPVRLQIASKAVRCLPNFWNTLSR